VSGPSTIATMVFDTRGMVQVSISRINFFGRKRFGQIYILRLWTKFNLKTNINLSRLNLGIGEKLVFEVLYIRPYSYVCM
jgi:hypothetical protein